MAISVTSRCGRWRGSAICTRGSTSHSGYRYWKRLQVAVIGALGGEPSRLALALMCIVVILYFALPRVVDVLIVLSPLVFAILISVAVPD